MIGSVHDQGTPQVVQVKQGKKLVIQLEWPTADANTVSIATDRLCEYVRRLWFVGRVVVNKDNEIVVRTKAKRSRLHWGVSSRPIMLGKRSQQVLRRTLNNQMPGALAWAKKQAARNKATAKTLHPAYK